MERFEQGAADSGEEAELMAFFGRVEDREAIGDILARQLTDAAASYVPDVARWQPVIDRILGREVGTEIVTRRRLIYLRYYAAAVVILLLGVATWLILRPKQVPVPAEAAQTSRFRNDVPPGGNRAILTLAGGKTVVLDSVHQGQLARQAGSVVLKSDSDRLTYRPNGVGGEAGAITYNILATPRGGQYRLTLVDGTRVWLDAASSIRYPTSFTGAERTVEVTGQAYFEVAHDAKHPFHVRVGQLVVEDIGTSFNVNAYAEEGSIRVTLIEGKVGLSTVRSRETLDPGQQAAIGENGAIGVTDHADLGEVLAWKNGLFSFNAADMAVIGRQISRWYDVDLVFRDSVPGHFVADIPRDEPVSKLLQLLELTGRVHFIIEGRKITVMR